MNHCNKCGRLVRIRPIHWQGNVYGEVCARAVGAPRTGKAASARKQAKQHAVRMDDGQAEMFAEVACAS